MGSEGDHRVSIVVLWVLFGNYGSAGTEALGAYRDRAVCESEAAHYDLMDRGLGNPHHYCVQYKLGAP